MWRKSQTIVMEADEPMVWIKLMIEDITLFYQYHDKPNETLTLKYLTTVLVFLKYENKSS